MMKPNLPMVPWFLLLTIAGVVSPVRAESPPAKLAPPVEHEGFLRPAQGVDAEPVWGIKGGIAVGLWPTSGPRGLFRIYTPYLGQPRLKVMNFIAIEPIVDGVRGLSELERSRVDQGRQGKAIWSVENREAPTEPRPPWRPVAGRIEMEDGRKVLCVTFHVEPFDNGARPIIEIRLREDRPREIELRADSRPDGKPMTSCILSATMGNYARLRTLYLKDRVIDVKSLYEPFQPVVAGFAKHEQWPLSDLLVHDGRAIVAARPDESDPASATYDPKVNRGWHYVGKTATQYWSAEARPGLIARVNARKTYWASQAPIPGGVSFENFELELPFEAGQSFRFGITPDSAAKLGFVEGH